MPVENPACWDDGDLLHASVDGFLESTQIGNECRFQGRFCGIAAAEIIGAELGISPEHAGRLRGQSPVKPLSLSTTQGEAA
jgi:hypothetical protein